MTDLCDIGILGSGPAALAVAAASSLRGASVTLVAPVPGTPWTPNYCLWADEVPPGFEDLAEQFWPEVSVRTELGAQHFERPYVKLDTQALQTFLWARVRSGTVNVVDSRATGLAQERDWTTIRAHDGASYRARVVIDASGGRSPFVRRVHGRPPAFQSAYGLVLEVTSHQFDPQRMTLMDFRPAVQDATDPPSFLYALPLSDGRLFVEETSLAHRPAVPRALLRGRLEARLGALGLERGTRLAEEHCSIPMGLGLPTLGQTVVPFGAAAAMVHPASGYMIAHLLREAEPVVDSILAGLDSAGPKGALESGNVTLWPRAKRRAWEIYTLGLEALTEMNAAQTSRFFDSFFQLSIEDWSGFLGGTLSPAKLGKVMTRLFGSLPTSLRWKLLRTSLSTGAAPLARTLLQPGMR